MIRFCRCILVILLLCILTLPLAVMAEDVATGALPAESTESPLDWEYLATIAGATAATLLIVQFSKVPLDKVWKIPTRWFVYVVALLILLAATAFTTGLTLPGIPLVLINAFIVSLSAYGSYEVTFAKYDYNN